MPKMKTHKAIAARVKVTGQGSFCVKSQGIVTN